MIAVKPIVRAIGLRRATLATAWLRAQRSALAAVHRHPASTPRILCYHSFGTEAWGVNDVTPAHFRRQLELAFEKGHRFVEPSLIAAGEGRPGDLAITFDDGLQSVADHALPILRELDLRATMFVVTDWVEGRGSWPAGTFLDWDGIRGLAAVGVAIGSHSVTHPDFGRLSAEQAAMELSESRRRIEAQLDRSVTAFAIPFGQSRNWTPQAQDAAREAGYEEIYAQAGRTRPEGTIPRTFVTRYDSDLIFAAALGGAFDGWEEWY